MNPDVGVAFDVPVGTLLPEGGEEWCGVARTGRCRTDGKSTTFAFQNAEGDLVAWSFVGPTGVAEEVPDATVGKILGTVRLSERLSEDATTS